MYQLTATLENRAHAKWIDARDDADAMMESISYIMDKAHKDQLGPWAKGRIELVDGFGSVVETMEAK